jgi:hypothetical protein
MKLLRYGSRGQEKPGLLDRGGATCLVNCPISLPSSFPASVYSNSPRSTLQRCPRSPAGRAWASRSPEFASSLRLASIMPITRPKPDCRCRRSRCYSPRPSVV